MANRAKRNNTTDVTRRQGQRVHVPATQRRTRFLRGGVAGIVLAALTAAAIYLLIPDNNSPTPPKAISTVDANHRICILSDPNDTALPTIDGGLQQAARDNGHLDIQHYTVPPSTTDATPMISSLINLRCAVIIGLGAQVHAALLAYPGNAQTSGARFIIVGTAPAGATRLSAIAPTALTPNAIAALVESDAK